MIIYECDPHYSSRDKGNCLICGAELKPREIKLSKYTQTRWRSLFGVK